MAEILIQEVLINGIFVSTNQLQRIKTSLSMDTTVGIADIKARIINVSERVESEVNTTALNWKADKIIAHPTKDPNSQCHLHPDKKHTNEKSYTQHPELAPANWNFSTNVKANSVQGKINSVCGHDGNFQTESLSTEEKVVLSQFDDYLQFFP